MKTKKKQVTLVYDCPLKGCDKIWLYHELKKRDPELKVLCPRKRLSSLRIGKTADRIRWFFYTLDLYFRCFLTVRKTDVLIVWNEKMSHVLNWFCSFFAPDIKIISFNWLTPRKKCKRKFLIRKAIYNPNFVAIINSEDSRRLYKEYYNPDRMDNFLFLPDTFDSSEPFRDDNDEAYRSEYFFTGGINNRDFELIFKVAAKFTEQKFVIVALKEHWKYSSDIIPSNVELHFNTSHEEYYALMEGARAVLLPLKDSKVAGLINICKSVQYGVICVTTKTPATVHYYDAERQKYLIEPGNAEQLSHAIEMILNYQAEEYKNEVSMMQRYIVENLSPEEIVGRMVEFAERYYGEPLFVN